MSRTCKCCGVTKLSYQFSSTGANGKPVMTCKDCNVWLRLFRQVFGPTRDWAANREKCRTRYRNKAKALYAVWGIGKP